MTDYTTPTKLRQFEICMSDGSVFVNAHLLSEWSPYFENLCFNEQYVEARNGKAIFPDIICPMVVAMCDYLSSDKDYMAKKEFNDSNLAHLVLCSHRFQIPSLQHDLEKFFNDGIEGCDLSPETLVTVAVQAERALFKQSVMAHIYKILSQHGIEVIHSAAMRLRMAVEDANGICEKIRVYLPVESNPGHSSAYAWNNFNRRMFF